MHNIPMWKRFEIRQLFYLCSSRYDLFKPVCIDRTYSVQKQYYDNYR